MIAKKGPIRVQRFISKQEVTVIIMTTLQAIFYFVTLQRAIIQDDVANLNQVSVTYFLKTIVAEVIFSRHGGIRKIDQQIKHDIRAQTDVSQGLLGSTGIHQYDAITLFQDCQETKITINNRVH